MTTAEVPSVYRRFATAVGARFWQGAVARQEEAIRFNPFLREHLRSEYAIAYQLERLRIVFAKFNTVPYEVCNDSSLFPALAFAAQVLEVLKRSRHKQAKTFVKRVRTAFASSENMHGLCLELQAATHFTRRGHSVIWHRVSNGGTFDLLVEDLGPNGLEVECKSISTDKGRRIHRRDALEFWGELWSEVAGVVGNLRSGLAVVLTVAERLPRDLQERVRLVKGIVARIIEGRGAELGGGASVRIETFDIVRIEKVISNIGNQLREVINDVTFTTNRESVLHRTPQGGILAFVMQSRVNDDVLDQMFATLDSSAGRQFTLQRGALFWVALQGIDADQLWSLHLQDRNPGERATGLTRRVSDFLNRAPDHIVGVVFGSRSGLIPVVDGDTDSGGMTFFFLKEESPHWHASFRDPLRALQATEQSTLAD